ncbi:MAG: heme ABC exporter ATP-binding protein CcmA [Actinobacteria bacterium]|nr:heme ABC exporter ATP-binding protein CcmA [Actinomycetota bacterium]
MSTPAIVLKSVVSMVGQFPVLAGVDLRVERGEVVVVEGPNGAGKSSLLRLCAGLLPVSRGEAQVAGYDLQAGRDEARKRIGLLGHAPALYDDLTVRENLVFHMKAARADPARIPGALERLGVGGRLESTRAGLLSAGQRRRVAIAFLVARHPEIWLLDEPHASLDAEGRAMLGEVVAQAAAAGSTMLIASHELEEALVLASRVVSISGGVVVGDGVTAAACMGSRTGTARLGAVAAGTGQVLAGHPLQQDLRQAPLQSTDQGIRRDSPQGLRPSEDGCNVA